MTGEATGTSALVDHIDTTLLRHWTPWPGGRPHPSEAALIDAALSIRAAYGRAADEGRAATGVHRSVERYRAENASPLDELERLTRADAGRLAELLGYQ
ncbi:hypothetical protein ABC795_11905 [Blastococcus sp. HT6-30]|uniref:hypothetical protein n=1 Tax=Blastococcus sp. HT6-30 TaxID=3144843 RepID=UPI00321B355D